ncbi:MAG TPA: extracellular solute-binding protein [Chloroflexota bacterium]|nr:extracellular solute-binding protein [Chloroflexota bacterium]
MTRRRFVRLVAAGGIVAASGVLAACEALRLPGTGPATLTPSGTAGGALKLPTYVPVASGPKPDLPGTADLEAAYFSFPTQFYKSVKQTPANGSDITVMTWTTGGPVIPLDDNAHWQAINKQTGANIKLVYVSNADYRPKFAATIAGGELPDVMYVADRTPIQQLPAFLKASCADLTPYLSGDAIKNYPNLANIPTDSWRSMVFGGGIYGLPVTFSPISAVHWVHLEMIEEAGARLPNNADDYKRVLMQTTKPQAGVYGLASYSAQAYGADNFVYGAMFGAPNGWAADANGKLTSKYETDQYRAAIGYVRDLVAAGVFHPNSPTYSVPSVRADFANKKHVFGLQGWSAASVQFWDTGLKLNPPSKVRVVPPFAHDGGQASYFLGPRIFGFSILKKGSPERIQEMLRLMDYFAAPFGSEEHLLLHYGVRDVDFTVDANGSPILTAKGQAEVSSVWSYIVAPPPVLYDANASRDYATAMQDGEKSMLAVGVKDPTAFLYSDTAQSQQEVLRQKLVDGLNEIVQSRQPLAQLDQLVKDWRVTGGDQMRSEFEQAWRAAPT